MKKKTYNILMVIKSILSILLFMLCTILIAIPASKYYGLFGMLFSFLVLIGGTKYQYSKNQEYKNEIVKNNSHWINISINIIFVLLIFMMIIGLTFILGDANISFGLPIIIISLSLFKVGYNIKKNKVGNKIKTEKNSKQMKKSKNKKTAKIKSNMINSKKYDFFISHASEDKDDFVRPLVQELENNNLKIWYDEFTLKIGDSLRTRIDDGLKNSRFGIVVLSNYYFSKNWTQYELNGLVTKAMDGKKVILPIWHNVTPDDVKNFSLPLADLVAINSSSFSIKEIANQITELV